MEYAARRTISGHTFVDNTIYVFRATQQDGESWFIAQLDPGEATPSIRDLGVFLSPVAR